MDIADGEILTTGGAAWKVIHTPGHTPGGVCYYSAENRLLLSGDTLFAGSIGRTDLAGGDADAMTKSLARLAAIPGDMPVLPGHGPETSLERERQLNPFLG